MRDLVLTDSKILNIVTFNGDDDPTKAVNWSRRTKWSIVAVLSLMTLTTYESLFRHYSLCFAVSHEEIVDSEDRALASSMLTPGVGQIMTDFQSESEILRSFVVSVYILGYASGPLIIAPLSELYGRLLLYHVTNILYVIFTVACALSPNLESLIVFRLLSGMAGSAVLNIGGGTIADLFVQEERGTAMSVWTVGPLLGPVIGPVAGGFLSEAKGWRAVFWVLSGLVSHKAKYLVFLLI